MESIEIHPDANRPHLPGIYLNIDSNKCSITGKSYMEEPMRFYSPVINWFKEYVKTYPDRKLILDIKLSYYNTSTSKMLALIMIEMKRLKSQGGSYEINWFFNPEDEDMDEGIDSYIDSMRVNINKISI
jgi:hypothetical protein